MIGLIILGSVLGGCAAQPAVPPVCRTGAAEEDINMSRGHVKGTGPLT
ncbi:hypothetical protein [Candidatus Formimonas warabiya]|nr:hypothetical protein [Candidatus Formimonas warabiya]